MFDIGWSELLVIAVVAILVVGPKDLPRMLRTFGRYAGKVRRTANEFRQQFEDAIRESELDEIRTSMESVRDINPMADVKSSMDEIRREAEKPAPATATEPVKTEPATAASATPERDSPETSGAEPAAAASGDGARAEDSRPEQHAEAGKGSGA